MERKLNSYHAGQYNSMWETKIPLFHRTRMLFNLKSNSPCISSLFTLFQAKIPLHYVILCRLRALQLHSQYLHISEQQPNWKILLVQINYIYCSKLLWLKTILENGSLCLFSLRLEAVVLCKRKQVLES